MYSHPQHRGQADIRDPNGHGKEAAVRREIANSDPRPNHEEHLPETDEAVHRAFDSPDPSGSRATRRTLYFGRRGLKVFFASTTAE